MRNRAVQAGAPATATPVRETHSRTIGFPPSSIVRLSDVPIVPWFGLIIGIAVVLSGCGRSEKSAEQRTGKAAKPPLEKVAGRPAVSDEPTEDRQPDQAVSRSAGEGMLFSGEAFEVIERQPNYEILGPEPAVKESDVFAVAPPPPGADSTSFSVRESRAGAPATGSQPNPEFKLPEGFTPLPDQGYSERGLPLSIRCEKDGAAMTLVPAGVFHMGTNDGPPNASPQMTVYLDPYYIDVTEVTVAEFEMYRADVLKTQKRFRPPVGNASAPPDHPALGVTWGEARFYARWAGKELPTEAEWEKAGRGPDGYAFPWGNGRAIWPGGRSITQIDPVRSYQADRSRYGVFDLAGNAREWCLDFYAEHAFRDALQQTTAAVLRNWQGPSRPSEPNLRVVKGNGPHWELWHRTGLSMRESDPAVGFRCVLRVKLPDASPAP